MLDVPPAVKLAYQRAAEHDFGYSCEPLAGRLLATLSAAVPPHGRILELGTGVGAGLGWIAHGLAGRDDVTVVSVENDERTAEIAARGAWPASFELRIGDAERLLPVLGSFDLLFADAQGGKWSGLDLSVAALAPGGVLLVDDMDPSRYAEPEHVAVVDGIRRTLTGHEHLVTTELPIGSGLILATRRR